jgi:L-amino acid N-acyltransferase YncA
MNIRQVELEDAAQIADIYDYYIANTHHTFETEPLSDEDMRGRIAEIRGKYPYLVAEDENGEIQGYVYAAPFRLRQAYEHSVEASIYVRKQAKEKGVGSKLYEKFLEELSETNFHTIIAAISLPNDASVRFHQKMGFEKVGQFKDVGYKLGRWVDVGFWQMMNKF